GRDVQGRARVGERTHRQVVDTGTGHTCGVLQGQSTGGLQTRPSPDQLDRFAQLLHREVVQQDLLGACLQRLLDLVDPVHLDLQGQLGKAFTNRPDRGPDTAGGNHVVVLDQARVAQTVAVVDPAPTAHRVLVQCAQPRPGLTAVADAGPGTRDRIHPGTCGRGDPGHVGEQVEGGAFRGEQVTSTGRDRLEHTTTLDGVTVLGRTHHPQRVVRDQPAREFGERKTTDRTCRACHHLGGALLVSGGGRHGRDVDTWSGGQVLRQGAAGGVHVGLVRGGPRKGELRACLGCGFGTGEGKGDRVEFLLEGGWW